jgi:rod shape-determining protein MreB
MCLPAVANKTTYDMVRKVLSKGGVKKVRFVKRPVAMALGVGISRTEIGGRMVMEIGGGLSEAAVVCLGEVASASSVEVGGQDIDMAICNYLRDRYELVIPVKTAEQLKIALGTDFSVQQSSFRQGDNRSNIRISARDSVWGRPRVIDIPAKELLEICQDKLSQTLQTAHKCLLETSEELLEDISLTGIWIGGGTALLKGFPELLAESTSLPVHMPVVSSEYVLAGIMRYWRMKGARKLYAHA